MGALQPVGGAKGTGQRRAWARRTLHPVAVIARREQVRDTPLRCEPCARATMRCGNGRTPCVKCPGGQLILAFVPASSDKMPAWRLVSTPARARIGVVLWSVGATAAGEPSGNSAVERGTSTVRCRSLVMSFSFQRDDRCAAGQPLRPFPARYPGHSPAENASVNFGFAG